jgi:hypothetical protein
VGSPDRSRVNGKHGLRGSIPYADVIGYVPADADLVPIPY